MYFIILLFVSNEDFIDSSLLNKIIRYIVIFSQFKNIRIYGLLITNFMKKLTSGMSLLYILAMSLMAVLFLSTGALSFIFIFDINVFNNYNYRMCWTLTMLTFALSFCGFFIINDIHKYIKRKKEKGLEEPS